MEIIMKMKKCKVLMAFLSLSCVLALKIPIQVNAKVDSNQNGEISVQYLQLESVLPSLSITNGTATCKGTVRSKNGTKCSATITLQKKSNGSWVNVISWTGSGIGSCTVKGSKTVSKGISYRVKIIGKCGTESSTKYSIVKSY